MVYEQFDEPNFILGTSDTLPAAYSSSQLFVESSNEQCDEKQRHNSTKTSKLGHNGKGEARLSEIKTAETPYQQQSFLVNNWSAIAESTLPLRTSEFIMGANKRNYGGIDNDAYESRNSSASVPIEPNSQGFLQASLENRSREISRKLIYINLISLLINLILALVAFYFSFANNSSSTSAFAADCVLDFISSGIVLWRYHGDLNSVYMQAREQIACIYLGALFEISAIGIIIMASSDIASGVGVEVGAAGVSTQQNIS